MFYKLVFAHLVADFVLQPRWLVLRKRHWDGLVIHAGIVLLAMLAVAWNEPAGRGWLLAIAAAHAAIDWGKIYLEPRLRLPPILPFLADQAAHLLSIAIAAASIHSQIPCTIAAALHPDKANAIWIVAIAYITATFAASIALPIWLNPPALMKRTLAPRLATIVIAALVFTLSWQGLGLVIPLVALGVYALGARWLARTPATATLDIELLSAMVLATGLGWALR